MATATQADRLEQLIDRGNGSAVFPELRQRGVENFARLGFPSADHEEWRYTNVSSFTRRDYVLPAAPAHVSHGEVSLCGECAGEIVLVNGRFSPERSTLPAAPGVTAGSLGEIVRTGRGSELVEQIGTVVSSSAHAFAAMNEALLDDVAILHVSSAARLTQPIHVVFSSEAAGDAVAVNVRLLVVVERGGALSVIETFHGRGSYLVNEVTEIIARDGAVIDHSRVVRDSFDATHIGHVGIQLQRDAAVRTRLFSFGGGTVRNELTATLDGEGADLVADGLYVLAGTQRVDNHTVIEHRRPHTNSVELYKGIFDGASRGAFDGKIVVHKAAQKIVSRQTNKNLLLSSEAIADSKPQLEIYADDVKCNHGSTIGQLDEESLFYLQSRGISLEDARSLLTFGFAREIIDRVPVAELKQQLETELLRRVPPSGEQR